MIKPEAFSRVTREPQRGLSTKIISSRVILILRVLVAAILFGYLGNVCSAAAVVADRDGIVQVLDNQGIVWLFDYPFALKGLHPLKGAPPLVSIVPWGGIDKDGGVWTWSGKAANVGKISDPDAWPDFNTIRAVYTSAVELKGVHNAKFLAIDGRRGLVASRLNDGTDALYEMNRRELVLPFQSVGHRLPYTGSIQSLSVSLVNAIVLSSDGRITAWGKGAFFKHWTSADEVKLEQPLTLTFDFKPSAAWATDHSLIVRDDLGETRWWGGCWYSARDSIPGHYILETPGLAVPISHASFISGYRQYSVRDGYLTTDGQAWLAYPPEKGDGGAVLCKHNAIPEDPYREPVKIEGVPVVSVALVGDSLDVLAVSADASLWIARPHPGGLKFEKLPRHEPGSTRSK